MNKRLPPLWLRTFVLVAASLLCFTACSSEEIDETPFLDLVEVDPDGPSVLIVGDSISFVSYLELTKALSDKGWNHAISGDIGSTTEDNRAKIRGAIEQDPDVVVVQLGTNDAGSAAPKSEPLSEEESEEVLAGVRDEISGAMNDLQVVPCVIWVDVNTWTNSDTADFTSAGASVNQIINDEASAYPNVEVAGYEAFFTPSNDEKLKFLADNFDADFVHPDQPAARVAFATLVTETISNSCGI